MLVPSDKNVVTGKKLKSLRFDRIVQRCTSFFSHCIHVSVSLFLSHCLNAWQLGNFLFLMLDSFSLNIFCFGQCPKSLALILFTKLVYNFSRIRNWFNDIRKIAYLSKGKLLHWLQFCLHIVLIGCCSCNCIDNFFPLFLFNIWLLVMHVFWRFAVSILWESSSISLTIHFCYCWLVLLYFWTLVDAHTVCTNSAE